MAINKETLAVSMAYTKATADALGAVKGAPCQILSIEKDGNVNTVTFQWEGDSGAIRTDTMQVVDGGDGVSIVGAFIDANNRLIITMSDGSEIDCGIIQSNPKLKESLTATVEIGTVTNGKTYPVGTDMEQIIRDMLIKYLPPSVSLSTTPATRLYDIVTDSISTILLKVAVTKKTNPVTKVSFYAGDTLKIF